MTMRVGRVVVLSGLAVAIAVGPALAGGADRVDAQCLATFGSLNDGICLDGPSAPAPGFPSVGVGPTDGGGPGLTTSSLFPGQTIDIPVPIG
ncbi:DUF7155 family protein [Mycobacterium sp.]|jgi:hypothetical protein|uniref:DUF7155 family protein n=1 Tax=Mycobacterium sp. TaxID=1785 RepID=UPI003C73ADAB